MRRWLMCGWVLCLLFTGLKAQAQVQALAQAMNRDQALAALVLPDTTARLAGVLRLAVVGEMRDADALIQRLNDDDTTVRAVASAALGQVWSRSGDAEVDRLLMLGTEQMQSWDFDAALSTFNDVVQRRPEFAEGWNKRATLYFLRGEWALSLKDCDEVLKRNPRHFGALSGAGQIHVQLGDARAALDFFKRALAVNPHLPGALHMVPRLEEHLRARGGQTI